MFSIVVVNWNGEGFLEKFFNSLVNQEYKDFNIYFIDNGSVDNSIAMVEKYKEKLDIIVKRLDRNYGFAEANNIGIELSFSDKNPYVITLNNDLELKDDCFKRLKSSIESNKEYSVFQLLMINYFDRDIIDAAGIDFNYKYYVTQLGYKQPVNELSNYKADIYGVCAGAAAYSKQCLSLVKDKYGYFDNRFFAYYEDADLALRIKEKGFKSMLVKDSIVYHVHSGTGGKDSSFKTYYLTRNQLLYLNKNLDETTFNTYKKYYYASVFKRIFKFALRFDMKNTKAMLRGFFDYFKIR